MTKTTVMFRVGGFVAMILLVSTAVRSSFSSAGQLVESRKVERVARYEIFELTFKHSGIYEDKFFDVALNVIFTSPSGTRRHVKGFFYGDDVWKVRFVPDEVGRWIYKYVMTGKGGFRTENDGAFDCPPSSAEGSVGRHPENPHRWVFANRRPYFPVGLQDCVGSKPPDDMVIDGEGRTDNAGRRVSQDEYFSIYGQAGFNLFRFSQQNCSYPLFDDLDHYREAESIATDKLLSLARKHGFRVMFGFFGFYRSWWYGSRPVRIINRILESALGVQSERPIHSENHEKLFKEERFIDYAVARWGVYVDFWELLNEREASDEWTTLIANYVRSVDPDRKPIGTDRIW